MRSTKRFSRMRLAAVGVACTTLLSGCGFSPYALPLPGGADVGSDPYRVKIQFRDVLDLVPQSAVKVDDLSVGKVTDIKLRGWTALVTIEVNRDVKLPDNAQAELRQTSLLGEKFVSLSEPETGGQGSLGNGDFIPLARSGRNPEIEEVLSAFSLILNGGGLERTATITKELGDALGGREGEIKALLSDAGEFMGELDDNKEEILTALERVDRLATETNKQKEAIVGALDTLPGALQTFNEQRDDLVRLLQALNRLSDVGTRVIDQSKDAFIADLKALEPTLRQLTNAGDALPDSLSVLLTYPFPDAVVGTTPVQARNTHLGDYNNLSVRLDLGLGTLFQLLGVDIPGGADANADEKTVRDLKKMLEGEKNPTNKNEKRAPEAPSTDAPTPSTPDITGLMPKRKSSKSSGSPESSCFLPGLLCRPAPGGTTAVLKPADIANDTASLMLLPVVAK